MKMRNVILLPALASALLFSGGCATRNALAVKPVPLDSFAPAKAKVALALGSGGVRGAGHIGVLRELERRGIKPEFVAGKSAGAVVGGLWASGAKADELSEMASSAGFWDIADFSPGPEGFSSGSALRAWVGKRAKKQRIGDFPVAFAAIAVDLSTGREGALASGPAAEALGASSAIPGAFAPYRDGEGGVWADGGSVNPVPVDWAAKSAPLVLIASDAYCSGPRLLSEGFLSYAAAAFRHAACQNARRSMEAADVAVGLEWEPKEPRSMEGLKEAEAMGMRSARKALDAYCAGPAPEEKKAALRCGQGSFLKESDPSSALEKP